MSKEIQPPTPLPCGTYSEVPFEDYAVWEFLSSTRAKLAFRSLLHFKNGFNSEPSLSMRLGTFCHGAYFEPLTLLQTTVFEPKWRDDPRNTTADGARSFRDTKWTASMSKSFRELHAGKTILTEDEFHRVRGVAQTLGQCPVVKDLTAKGRPEVSIRWDDPSTGLACKSRCDWLRIEDDRPLIMDLKTTSDASQFERSISQYKYHFQLAFYRRAVQVVTGLSPEVWVVCVETTAPYAHRVARLDEDALEIGEREIDSLLPQIAKAYETDTWTSYTSPDLWRLPSWYGGRRSEPTELIVGGELLEV